MEAIIPIESPIDCIETYPFKEVLFENQICSICWAFYGVPKHYSLLRIDKTGVSHFARFTQRKGMVNRMKLIFRFPDDTAFFPGMGRDIYENFPEIRKELNKLRFFTKIDVRKFLYPEKEAVWTKDIKNAAVLVTCAVIYKEWTRSTGFTADYMYGSNVGAICALVCKRKIGLRNAVRRVRNGRMSAPFYVSASDYTPESCPPVSREDIVVDFFVPQGQSIEDLQRNKSNGLHIYLDDPCDSSYILDNILEKKLFNYLYAARRLQGIAVACQNHTESAEAFDLIDNTYKELTEKVQTELQKQQTKGELSSEHFFEECTVLLKRILEEKKAEKEDVSGQLLRLQNETAINMRQYFADWI